MKKSNEGKNQKRRKPKPAVGLPGEIPPVIIKSGGGGSVGKQAGEGLIELGVGEVFFMQDSRENYNPERDSLEMRWKVAFTPRWDYHEFHVYIGDDDVNFPLTVDSMILLTLNTGWVKFRAEPREENPHQTTLWIEASDYIFTVMDEPLLPERKWRNSNASALITGVEVYPQNSISKYTCPNGNVYLEFQERIILPNPD